MAKRAGTKRLVPEGLRWRLGVWVAFVVLFSSAVTFVVVYRDTGSELRHQIDSEISGESSELLRALVSSADHKPRQVAEQATRYIRGQPFGPSSTLLFAIVAGAPTSSNRPELFTAEGPDHGETVLEQDHENQLATKLKVVHDGYSTLRLPDVGNLRLLERSFTLPGGTRVTVGAGEPLAAVAHAQDSVARAFLLAGALALLGALVAAYVTGTRVSRPLRRMAEVAARVDAGDLHPRIHGVSGEAVELRVLADAFNHMLDRLTEAFAGQRAFVADASHELRTPLTVISGQLEVLAAQTAPSEPEVRRVERLVQAEIARITRLVDDLLLLAKAEQTEFLRTQSIELPEYVRELWDGMSLIAVRRFELGTVPHGVLDADPDRLAQVLRNLIANAIEHTAEVEGLVRMEVEDLGGEWIRFAVEDDGRGIDPQERERIFDRFHRTDTARDRASGGTGLGLAIVRAIAQAHGGRVTATTGRAGGARIELRLAGFRARGPSADAGNDPSARRSAPAH
ncbi:MAG TPA: HAMP domain-containing sensor histidine kinase [Solirubrobacteraceae bacterium]|nr:HAMP domain-containing sensor histidine kinase [Solirubrobacteraceae bacterium]